MEGVRKPLVNLVLLGEAGHGKSTLMGRLLYELGEVSEDAVARMMALAKRLGDEGRYLAFLVDTKLEERRQGHTIEASSWRPVDVGPLAIRMIDVPGVLDWVNNTITGVAQADAGLLVVDAREVAEKKPGALEGLREHLALALAFGLEQLIVAVNKMDLVGYEELFFEVAKSAVGQLMEQLGLRPTSGTLFVPISALNGANVLERASQMDWYDGPALYEALQRLKEPKRPVRKPLRMPIYRFFERSNVAAGVVSSGVVAEGDEVIVAPAGARGQVLSLESWGQRLESAGPGLDVGVRLRGVARYQVKKGFVIGHPDEAPRAAERLVARLRILDPEGLWAGFCPIVYCHQARAPCRIEAILNKLDPGTGDVLEEGPRELSFGEVGDVILRPLVPRARGLVVERYDELPAMSRLALRASRGSRRGAFTIAAGICLEVEPHG